MKVLKTTPISKEIKFLYNIFLKMRVKLKEENGEGFITWVGFNKCKPGYLGNNLGDIIEKYGVFKK